MRKVKNQEALDRITKARIHLITSRELVFFGPLSLRFKLVEDTSGRIPTMGTDGVRLIYNPDWVNSLPHPDEGPELRSVICHEVWHCALKHFSRCATRDPRRWNIATDYVIAPIIMRQPGLRLPEGCLYDKAYLNMNAEQVYAALPDQPSGEGGQGGWGGEGLDPGGCGAVFPYDPSKQESGNEGGNGAKGNEKEKDGKGNGNADKEGEDEKDQKGGSKGPKSVEDVELDWEIATIQSAQQTKAMGSHVPEFIDRMIDEMCHPKIPVRELLWDFVQRNAKNDYSWQRPSRRYAATDTYIPSLVSDELLFGVVAVDTSGSIDNEQLAKFLSGLSDILEAFETRVLVLYCDTTIRNEEEFCTGDLPIIPNPKGGGCTDFRPVFERIAELDEVPAYLLYFTDTFGTWPEEEPEYPVLWVSWEKDHDEPPIGELVYFDE